MGECWICHLPPSRGTVGRSADGYFWQRCLGRPKQFKQWSPPFAQLEEAFAWVEAELLASPNEPHVRPRGASEPPFDLASFVAQKRVDLADHWVEPGDLEPEQIRYRVLMELEHLPFDSKTLELSFGETWRYDERHLTPARLATQVGIDPVQFIIEQPLGAGRGWYRMRSRITYYQEQVAVAQAGQVWERSRTIEQHQRGQVLWAYYSVEEAETGHCIFLGGCEATDGTELKPTSREAYMTSLALRLTLLRVLDISGFRIFMGYSPHILTDEQLLRIMHQERAESSHLPAEVCHESQRWLNEHPL